MLDAGTQMVRRLLRDAAAVLGAALAAVLAAAVVAGWRAAAVEQYWQSGYPRLVTAAVWERFDVWGTVALAAALALAAGLALARWRGWRTPFPGRVVTRIGLVLLLLIIAFRVAGAVDLLRAGRGRPNVLLISIDTLRADRLGAYGYDAADEPDASTAASPARASSSTDVYSQSPKTTPSHMTMLTSLYPCVHGVGLWDDAGRGQRAQPRASHARRGAEERRLRDRGVHRRRARGPLARLRPGLRRLQARPPSSARALAGSQARTVAALLPLLPHLRRPRPVPAAAGAGARASAADYHGPILAAVDAAAARRRAAGPRRTAASGRASTAATPRDVRFVSAPLRRRHPPHGRRRSLTPLLDELDALGLARDTLVVFTSDHGEAFGEHGVFLHDDLYRETLHVPLVLRFPGRLPAGRRVDARARLLDLMPTVLDLLGVPAPADVQGRSLVPLVARRDRRPRRRGQRGLPAGRHAALREPPPRRPHLHRRGRARAALRPGDRSGRARRPRRRTPRRHGRAPQRARPLAGHVPAARRRPRPTRRRARPRRRDPPPAARPGVRRMNESETGVVNCAAYADGCKVGDVPLDDISEVLKVPGHFVWIGLHEPDEALLREDPGGVRPARPRGRGRASAPTSGRSSRSTATRSSSSCGRRRSRRRHDRVRRDAPLRRPALRRRRCATAPRSRTPRCARAARARRTSSSKGPGFVLYAIMDFVVDHYFPIVDELEERAREARGGDLRRQLRRATRPSASTT